MDPSCLEVNLNKVRCYCENDKYTVPPTYTTSLKCFVTNEDFGQGGGNMEDFRVVNVIQHLQKRPM